MKDKILTMFFDINRWTKAIEKGVLKDIRKSELIKLTEEPTRIRMAEAMLNGKYQITPPHIAQIPKDNGEFRTVYVNEPIDRIILSIANDLLFDLMPEMIHPACKSYQVGIGCGKVVLEVSHTIVNMKSDGYVGWKSDLSKYFDSVPIQFIDAAFDKVEAKCGHSVLIDVLRKYYHCGLYFDENNELHEKYQSLKQGCAVASWLANVLLYSLDDELSQLNGFYVRYSDDMLFVGPDYEKAMTILQKRLAEKSMNLNPKKVEYLTMDKWFKFLGFSIKGSMISFSPNRLKTFQAIIIQGTIPNRQLFRRWVMAQMFRIIYIATNTHGAYKPIGVSEVIHSMGYEYQWKMLNNELYAQHKMMQNGDVDNFRDRNRWFNKRVVLDMAKDYIEKLKKRFDELKLRKCKGIPYKRINGQNIFVDDFDKKVIKPLLFAVHKIQHSENTYELWHSVQEFNKRRIKMHWDTPQNAAWLDAYKGSGAFFTMQNMIRFHNCVIIDDNGKTLGKNASLAFLNKKAKLYENREGWRLIGMLKKMLDDNNIDVVAKMKEWRK